MLMTTSGDKTSLAGSPSPSTEAKTGIHTTNKKVDDNQKVSTPGEKPAPTPKDYIIDSPLEVPVIVTPANKEDKKQNTKNCAFDNQTMNDDVYAEAEASE